MPKYLLGYFIKFFLIKQQKSHTKGVNKTFDYL